MRAGLGAQLQMKVIVPLLEFKRFEGQILTDFGVVFIIGSRNKNIVFIYRKVIKEKK